MKTFEIHYQSPEGPKVTTVKTSAKDFIPDVMRYGISIERQTDILYIPAHAVIAITFPKG